MAGRSSALATRSPAGNGRSSDEASPGDARQHGGRTRGCEDASARCADPPAPAVVGGCLRRRWRRVGRRRIPLPQPSRLAVADGATAGDARHDNVVRGTAPARQPHGRAAALNARCTVVRARGDRYCRYPRARAPCDRWARSPWVCPAVPGSGGRRLLHDGTTPKTQLMRQIPRPFCVAPGNLSPPGGLDSSKATGSIPCDASADPGPTACDRAAAAAASPDARLFE